MTSNSPPNPRVTVIIVSYQSRDTIDHGLTLLAGAALRGELSCVLVDNKSTDGIAEYVRDKYTWVDVREPGKNLGFGRGCNFGAKGATSDYLFFLNPDGAIEEPELRKLVAFLDKSPHVGIVAPYLPQQHSGALTTPLAIIKQAWGLKVNVAYPDWHDIRPDEQPYPTNWVCGAAFLMRRDLFETLCGFDERFFLYFEETDLCLRATQAGYQLWILPGAVAAHQQNFSAKRSGKLVSSGVISEFYFQSRSYFLKKHYGSAIALATVGIELLPISARELASWIGVRAKNKATGFPERLRSGLFRLPRFPD